MATPARPHLNEASATPALLSASSHGLYSSSSPSVRTPRDDLSYQHHHHLHQPPAPPLGLSSSGVASSGTLTSAKLLDRTLNSAYGAHQHLEHAPDALLAHFLLSLDTPGEAPFDYAPSPASSQPIRPFPMHANVVMQGNHKLQPAPPLMRSQTMPSYTSSYLQAWDATHTFQPAQHAPPHHHIAMQRSSSASYNTDKDADASRYDKRRKMRHSSPPAEEIEHLQLAPPTALPMPSRPQTMSYPSPTTSSLHPSVSIPFCLQKNGTLRPNLLPQMMMMRPDNGTARPHVHIPPRALSAQPDVQSNNKRKASMDQLQVEHVPHHRSVSPVGPSFYSHTAFQGDDDDSTPSSPVGLEHAQLMAAHHHHHLQQARPALATSLSTSAVPTRRSTRHKSDEDGFSSSTSEYNPDGTTPARTKRIQPHKQGKKKASKKAAALMSDPEYAAISSVPTPRIVNKKPDNGSKPSYSYAALIGQAILSTDHKLLSLNDIYCFIMVNYTYFKKDVAGWQNSIRHNLSLNPSFVKVARSTNNPGKGSLWTIKSGDEELFANGGYIKRAAMQRSASSSHSAQPPSAPASPSAPMQASSPEDASPYDPPAAASTSATSLEPPVELEEPAAAAAAPPTTKRQAARAASAQIQSDVKEAQCSPASEHASVDASSPAAGTPEPPVHASLAIHVEGPSNRSVAPGAATAASSSTSVKPDADLDSEALSDADGKAAAVEPPAKHHHQALPADSIFSKPEAAAGSSAAEAGEGQRSLHQRRPSLFASPVQRLRSPRRNSLSGVPHFDYASMVGCTPGADHRSSRAFGTPAQRSPEVFNSPAYYFSSEAYGDPNGSSHYIFYRTHC